MSKSDLKIASNITTNFSTTNNNNYVISGGTGSVTGATNGLNVQGDNVRLGGTLTGSTTIYLDSNNLVIAATTGTLDYGGDYSSNFNLRSIPDVNFVTGITSQLGGGGSGWLLSGDTVLNGDARIGNPFYAYSPHDLTFEVKNISLNASDSINISSYTGNSGINSGGYVALSANYQTGYNQLLLYNEIHKDLWSGENIAVQIDKLVTGTSSIHNVLDLHINFGATVYPASNGIGAKITFRLENDSTTSEDVPRSSIASLFTDVTENNEESEFRFNVVTSGVGETNILSINKDGAKYASDHSTNFTIRSLVDVGFVTGITSQIQGGTGFTNAGNGLTRTGSTIILGGQVTNTPTIIGNTTVGGIIINDDFLWGNGTGTTTIFSGDGTWGNSSIDGSYRIALSSPYLSTDGNYGFASIYADKYDPSGGTRGMYSGIDAGFNDYSQESFINIYSSVYDTVTNNQSSINIDLRGRLNATPSAQIYSYHSGFSGIVYGGDYSANFTARSLVDAGFVTGITSQIQGGGGSGTVTGGTNGLNVQGANIRLGGLITGDTILSGVTIYTYNYGTKDSTFNIGSGFGGASPTVQGLTLQTDGKLLVSGPYSTFTGSTIGRLIRLNPNGTKDSTFNIGTGFGVGGLNKTVVQSDNKIYGVGGFTTFTGSTNNQLIRLNSNGTKDSTFNIGTGFGGQVQGLIIQQDSKLLVFGGFTTFTGSTAQKMIRLNSNGTKDSTFNVGSGFVGGSQVVMTAAIQTDGKIIVGGEFTTFTGSTNNRLIRLNSNGTKDSTFNIGTGFNGDVYRVLIQPDNKILVCGQFTGFTGTSNNKLIRLNPNGTKDSSFNIGTGFGGHFGGSFWSIIDMKIQSDGKIIVGGEFTRFTGSTNNHLMRLNSNGTKDSTFNVGTGFDTRIRQVLLSPDNTDLFIGGDFTTFTGSTNNSLIKLNNYEESRTSLIQYNADFSNYFTSRTLVDKGYITGVTKPYKVYTALLTQTGTTAPTAIVLENTFGVTPTFQYGGVGSYNIVASVITNDDKILVLLGNTNAGTGGGLAYYSNSASNRIVLSTYDSSNGSGLNSILLKTSIEIRIYN